MLVPSQDLSSGTLKDLSGGVESVDTPLFTSLAYNELWLAAIAASAIVVLRDATDFLFEGGGDATRERAFVFN